MYINYMPVSSARPYYSRPSGTASLAQSFYCQKRVKVDVISEFCTVITSVIFNITTPKVS
jgi:hypothetical protein